ncbi:MMPL family transporter [Nocardioides lianchengensis]|uniref:MMPL family transporter n=1 Tax=Nocardioides lianchengensis TaxID=1045774 RepID=UPI000B821113|nr:MMPL family transporter [Nocardioides lianchengensis]NYG12312.1 RND superfamily putative drug exporter [Nocardioides lianchengensis]
MSRVLTRRVAPALALLPLVVAILVIGLVGDGERTARPTDTLPSGSGSAGAAALIADLPESDGAAVVLFEAETGTLPESTVQDLGVLAERLGATSSDDRSVRVAEDGTAALAVVPIRSTDELGQISEVKALRSELAESTPTGVTAAVTGPAAVATDIDAVFDDANTRLLGATALVVALLLVITYRSPVLWIVPLAVIGVADRLAAVVGTQVMAGLGVAFDDATTAILSILVFGAGTDYALLLISRYRSELARHESRYDAMAVALRRTAEAVLTSAATVVLGVLTLALSLTPSTRALGVASAIGIAVASIFVLVVLPAALVCFGRPIFWPRVPHHAPDRPAEDGGPADRSVWARVSRLVSRRPRAVVAGSLALVAVASTGLFGISLGLDASEAFKTKPEAIVGAERLARSFPAGTSEPVQVVTEADPDAVLRAVGETEGVESTTVSQQADGVSLVEAVLASAPGSDAAKDTVETLRENLDPYPETFVGGTEAEAVDRADATRRDLLLIVPLLVLLVTLVLGGLLRSILAPVILVATVVATYAAALGASWWIFVGVLGYDGLETNVPLIAFVFLVALGIDYNIFLVTRALEETPSRGTREGMLHALRATGGVITSAGILLAAVFTVLGLLPAVGLAEIGVVICVGVLLDTLVIRTVLVPAVAVLLGDRFWWPRQIERTS